MGKIVRRRLKPNNVEVVSDYPDEDLFLELNSEKEKYELLASWTIDGLIFCDSEKKILFMNNSAKRLLGVEAEKSWIDNSLGDLKASFLIDYFEEAQKSNLHELNRVADLLNDHSKLVGVHLELLRNAKNQKVGWLFILRDVTRNWQSDQMRSALTVASHEIKTPLNSMLGAVDLLLEKDLGELNKKQHQCLDVIKDDIQRLNRLLEDILDLSRFDEGIQFLERRKQTSLIFLVKRVFDSFRSYAKSKDIQLINKIPKSIPTFKGDRDRLQQVFSNLVENGIKYSRSGGQISVHAKLEGSTIECCVKDKGVGIPSTEFETIFERFKQLDNCPDQSQRGYGLGLSISKEIIEGFGGRVWVESELGVGSSFYFTIPV